MQTINYLIVDGDVSGRIKCSIDESTIVAYRISRKHLSKGVDEFDKDSWTTKSGIYLLITKSNTDKPSVYIGQADQRKAGGGFIARLSEHLNDESKGEWSEAILLTVKDEYSIPLNALENKFWKDASEINRCTLLNRSEPQSGIITYERRGFFDNFVKYGEFFVGILGHKIYEPISRVQEVAVASSPTQTTDETFRYTRKDTLAFGKRTDEGFVVLKGAKIASAPPTGRGGEKKDQTIRLENKIKAVREEKDYAIDKVNWSTTEDLLFASANEAGGFVSFGITDHVNFWHETITDKTLGQIQKEEAEALANS